MEGVIAIHGISLECLIKMRLPSGNQQKDKVVIEGTK